MSISLTQLACPNCGAPLQYRPGMPVAKCPYCETEITLQFAQQNGRQVDIEPHRMRAFSTTKSQFEAAFLEWLADGEYTPDDVLSSVMVSEYTGVLVPFLRFTGEYRANFTADIGYDRRETKVRMTRNSEGKLEPETYAVTVTDWRPLHGEASDRFTFWGCASKKIPGAHKSWCETEAGTRGAEWKVLNEADITGYVLESFEQTSAEVFKQRVDAKVADAARKKSETRMPGDRSRNLRVDFRVEDLEHEKYYQPLWLASVDYRGEAFHYVRSGSSSAFEGRRPVDEERKKSVKAAMKGFTIALIVTVVLAVVGFLAGGLPAIPVVLIGVPLCAFLYLKGKKKQRAILGRSKEIRLRMLEKVKQKGGLRDAGGLSVSAADLQQIQEDLVEEAAAEQRRQEEEKDAEEAAREAEKAERKAEKKRAREEAAAFDIDLGLVCSSCDAPNEHGAEFCVACGADLLA